jgi:predicted ATPase/DNA-binding SARP family transcriptional activator
MEFLLLGPFEVVVDDRVVTPSAAKQRALLARLLVSANEPLTSTQLIEDLWEGRAPATAAKVLQTYVVQLRRLVGDETIASTPGGYELRVGPGELDVHRFERLVAEAADLEPEAAEARLRQALALWRGQPLADFVYDDWARSEIARLEELRLSALRRRIDCDLALGRTAELVGELELLVAKHPLDEGLCAQLMLALYRAHRQADALAVYRQSRSRLVEELGIEPGTALRRLESQILRQEPALEAPDRSTMAIAPWLRLPAQTTRFIGRHAELLSLRRLLQDPDTRAITLTGPAGVGKTRLAIEAAGVLEPDFPDGIVFVDLAPIPESDKVVATIAETLGLGETPGRPQLEVLVALLHGRRILLLLDNFEHVRQAAPMLQDLLDGAARVKLLITSRVPLGLGSERIVHVASLRLPDRMTADVTGLEQAEAVRLFVDRATAERPEFMLTSANAEAVVEVCRRLDGLPLALELAAARCSLLSPRALLERLASRLDLLRAAPGSGLTERQWTLRGAIEWSYELLDPREQQLFASLGVFVGGFTLSAADHVAEHAGADILDGVESLVRNNLLSTAHAGGDEPRVGMLESIREYALERLAARGDGEAVRRQHAGFYLDLSEEAEPGLVGPQQPMWLDRLAAELENIRVALTWAVEAREAEVGLRIASALWRFWQLRDHAQEGRERLERLLAIGTGSPSIRATAQTRTGAGAPQRRRGRPTVARREPCRASASGQRPDGRKRPRAARHGRCSRRRDRYGLRLDARGPRGCSWRSQSIRRELCALAARRVSRVAR